MNENENTTTPNLWDTVLKKQWKSQINNLILHLKQLEKKEMKTPGLVEGKKS